MKRLTKINIQQFYPEAEWHPFPKIDTHKLIYFIEDEWCHFDPAKLSEKDRAFLDALFEQAQFSQNSLIAEKWLAYLTGSGPAPKATSVRIIQFRIQQDSKSFDLTNWSTLLVESLDHALTIIWLDDCQGLVVQEKTAHPLFAADFLELFATLDADFFLTTTIYLGEFYPTQAAWSKLLANEQELFRFGLAQYPNRRVLRFVDIALAYSLAALPTEQPVLKELSHSWELDAEFAQIVQALWRHQGNVSSAAKELYLHRNTLTYRLDRFETVSGFSLRSNQALFFCLLLLEYGDSAIF